jgi:peptide/nickel transport system permease protein
MTLYVLRRLATLPLALLVVSFLTFSIVHLVPGDAVDVLGGDFMTEAQRTLLRRQYQLDDPFLVQYVRWLGRIVQGDFGMSIRTGRPVFDEVVSRLGTTIELAVMAIVMALIIGIVSGAAATRWRGRLGDRLIMSGSILGMSMPNYFTATIFILLISLYAPSIGVASYAPITTDVAANLKALFFPALALAIASGASFCRYVRVAAEDVLRTSDFVRTARAKGASDWHILFRHVIPNSLIPLTTVAGLQFALLIGGTVVIETIFALPGIGQLMIAAIQQRDFAVVQGCVMLQTFNFVVINLVIDLLYPVLDPRVRVGAGCA